MDTIFMNSENSKTPKLHVLILKLTYKLDLRLCANNIALSSLSIYYTWRNIKRLCNYTITINLKYPHQHGMINLNYHMYLVLCEIFKIISSIFLKNMEKILMNYQYKYISIKLKIGSHLKLKMGIVLNL